MADEEQQPVEQATPIFRIRPHDRKDRVADDGATWRVHTFLVVNEAGEVVTEDTHEGPTSAGRVRRVLPRIRCPIRAEPEHWRLQYLPFPAAAT